MPNRPHRTTLDLQEARNRNRIARETLAHLSDAMPRLTTVWLRLDHALTNASLLIAEAGELRRDSANLAAAARATLHAHHDAEPDPLYYLRDELRAQGFLPPDGWGRA
ncbi:hypothetical protein [Actinomadura rayongensis]|uniref:Uncharacterized protein n=1 Tax=Actinomadura rayongensis TaxID=1429076 RepID=A0A6I4WMP5_9ACTN|nr:hypothetical protein [Actinomadura rayongensis]MXQ68204.1 hypothetical protein [Actinomadura rayongensis]